MSPRNPNKPSPAVSELKKMIFENVRAFEDDQLDEFIMELEWVLEERRLQREWDGCVADGLTDLPPWESSGFEGVDEGDEDV